MPGCIFHAVGQNFDPNSTLHGLTLQPYSIFKRGDPLFNGSHRFHAKSGFKCDVSVSHGDLKKQVADAIVFLRRFEDELRKIASAPGIESIDLDFGYDLRIGTGQIVVQFDYLPPELLRLCGSLGLGIELSLYPMATETLSELGH